MAQSQPANSAFPATKKFGTSFAQPSSGGAYTPPGQVQDVLVTLTRGSSAGTIKLIQGMTQTQHTLDTFAASAPRSAAGNRNGGVIDLVTAMTSGTQPPVGYNNHVMGFGTTNGWGHPPKAVAAYQVAQGNWSTSGGAFFTQENPYFYPNNTSNATHTPISSADGTQVGNSPATNKPQTSGLDVRQDTVTLLGCTSIITLCMCPDWMTSNFQTIADYAQFAKFPPLSTVATNYTTLHTGSNATGVPTELLNLAAQTSPTDHAVLGDGKRGLYFMDYWRYLVKQVVTRYCIPSVSEYLQGLSGTINTGGNTQCTILQVWNEFGGIDFPTGTIGGNNFGDHSINEEVFPGFNNKTNGWDYAQYAWLYGHTYAAINEAFTDQGTTRAAQGVRIAGPYGTLRWNYYDRTTGTARATPLVVDNIASTYYGLAHADQVAIANWLMFRSGTGNAYPAHASGITQRSGTVPQWTPYASGHDKGVAQDILPYDMDMICFDGFQRRSTDPVGQAVSSLPDQLEPARTAAEWKAQLLLDTANYEQCYADLILLMANCGRPGLPIIQSENYSDVTLDSGTPVVGLESTSGTNHQYYADHQWTCAQTASQWLHMAKGGGSYVLRWAPEGLTALNKNAITATDLTSYYWPAWAYQGNQQSLWADGRVLATAGITDVAIAPGHQAWSTPYSPGDPFPLYDAYKAFHDHFSVNANGTARTYYAPTVTTGTGAAALGIEALDNGQWVMIINKAAISRTCSVVKGVTATILPDLAPYEVRLVSIA